MSSSHRDTASAQASLDPLDRAGALVGRGKDSVVMFMDSDTVWSISRRPCIVVAVCLVVLGTVSIAVAAAAGKMGPFSVPEFLGMAGVMVALGVFGVLMLRWKLRQGTVIFDRDKIVVAWGGRVREIAASPRAPVALSVSDNGKYWRVSKDSPRWFTTRLKLPTAGFPGLDHLVETYNTTGLDGLFRLLDQPTNAV